MGHDHVVVVVSDFDGADEESEQLLRSLARHNDVVVVPIYDPSQMSLPKSGRLVVGNGELQVELDFGQEMVRRGLLAFDLSGMPARASVLSATLTLTMSKSIAGTTPVALPSLAHAWAEGAADAPGEQAYGASAGPAHATPAPRPCRVPSPPPPTPG